MSIASNSKICTVCGNIFLSVLHTGTPLSRPSMRPRIPGSTLACTNFFCVFVKTLNATFYVSRLNEIESFLPLCSLINYYHHALCMPSLELNYLKWFILVLCTDSVEVLILVPSKGQPCKFSFCRTDYLLYTTQLDTCIFRHILHRHVSVVCTDTHKERYLHIEPSGPRLVMTQYFCFLGANLFVCR